MIRLKVAASPNEAKQYLKKYNKVPTHKIHNAWKPDKKFFSRNANKLRNNGP